MFRKTIAVLLLFSIVLSSCGKKDKGNDFTRVTPNQESAKSLYDAVNAFIGVHLSCSVPSEACNEAKTKDPQRLNTALWQDCLESKPCHEKEKSFHKARVDCFEAELDFSKLEMSCLEAQLTCPESKYPERDCPESKLACDKVYAEMIETSGFECPDYTPVLPSPEYVEAKKKYLDNLGYKVVRACAGYKRHSSVCWKAYLEEQAFFVTYIESKLSCLKSEPNVSTPSL